MITKPTVLVLGAGASIPFGFPSGRTLRDIIVGRDRHVIEAFEVTQLGQDALNAFTTEFEYSGTESIDAFLANRPDLLQVGKIAIAGALIPFENSGKVHSPPEPNWLHILARRMDAPVEAWGENKLSIVTFNYDRVIENFLHLSLKHRFKLSDADAANLMGKTVKIIHLHGQLGGYPYVAPTGRLFRNDVSEPGQLQLAADGIRVVHEGAKDDPQFVEARRVIADAHEVVFLGFGYGPENMERLDLPQTLNGQKLILGSGFGLFERERTNAMRQSGDLLRIDQDEKCSLYDFLRKHPLLGH